jgi:hypothetical protein
MGAAVAKDGRRAAGFVGSTPLEDARLVVGPMPSTCSHRTFARVFIYDNDADVGVSTGW